MILSDAIERAGQVLAEERRHPTISYKSFSNGAEASLERIGASLDRIERRLERETQHPRPVRETPEHQFQSINFDLLCAIWDQVADDDRPTFLAAVNANITNKHNYHHLARDTQYAGSWQRCSSELPLVAEFMVRRGDKHMLFKALRKASLTPGLTLLLVQLEEMIALNFTLFTAEEYDQIRQTIVHVHQHAIKLNDLPNPADTTASNIRYHVGREIPQLCTALVELCRKAKYLYVKDDLLPGMNLEVNQDKNMVRGFLEKLGFPQLLVKSLDEAEKLYRIAATPFELKSCLGHLRSFVEQLHIEAAIGIHNKLGGTLPFRWGEALQYLFDQNVMSKQERQLFASLYTLVSDTGVHPLIADREYARLMRNMSIECGLLLLTKLDQMGINLAAKTTVP
jgi:hypothetical protein